MEYETCPRCEEIANVFTAVITKTDETKRKQDSKQKNLGSPMLMCLEHSQERKQYFEEMNRKVVMIENYDYEKLQ